MGSIIEIVCPTWWRHQTETFSALLALCTGNSPVPVNSPHKGQWRGALMFSLICAWINDWVSNREAGDLRRHRGHYDVNVMNYDMGKQLFSGVSVGWHYWSMPNFNVALARPTLLPGHGWVITSWFDGDAIDYPCHIEETMNEKYALWDK